MKYFVFALLFALFTRDLSAAEPIDIGSRRQLFPDDFIIECIDGLTRTMHQPEKRGPVLKAEEPWEGVYIAVFSPPMWIPDERVFKQVYECRYDKSGVRHRYALATSKDGVHWEKPKLGLVEFDGSKATNLFPTPDNRRLVHVVFDPDDPDPQRRYKGLLTVPRGRVPVVSGACLNWKKLDAKLPSSDAGTMAFDPERRLFMAMLKRSNANTVRAGEPIDIGARRELFVDQYLIERLDGVRLELHRPERREIVFRTDAPWEGNGSAFQSVFQDGDRFRMYYRGGHHPASKAYETDKNSWETLCLAESKDGIHWTRPELGIVEFRGSSKNNLILDEAMVRKIGGSPAHTAVFKDTNPDCPRQERYKIVIRGRKPRGLYLLVSADGVHFQLKSDEPFTTAGAFDSQNLMFWDSVGAVYREYHRNFDKGVRGIMTAASKDPGSFPKPQWLEYPGADRQALYTNQVQAYYRAPHIFMGFPMRYNDRGWSQSMTELPGLEERQYRAKQHPRYGTTVTDAAFMTSRDGVTFHRWGEAFIRPGPARKDTWVYGDNFIFWGMVQTKSHLEGAPDEISLYATEGYWEGSSTSFRRYTLRIDGFVSAQAPLIGGEVVTKPLTFDGSQLEINSSTSAAGSVRVELQDAEDKPIPGFALTDCHLQYGDQLDRVVSWKSGTDVARLAGQPVRLRFELKDADLYSFQFTASN